MQTVMQVSCWHHTLLGDLWSGCVMCALLMTSSTQLLKPSLMVHPVVHLLWGLCYTCLSLRWSVGLLWLTLPTVMYAWVSSPLG